MNQHVEIWIDAYLDGELTPKQTEKFERHLETCPNCLALLEERESISRLLNSIPLPETTRSDEDFVQDIKLLLPREQNKPGPTSFGAIWIVISILILGAISFLFSINLITNFMILVPGMEELVTTVMITPSVTAAVTPWIELFFNQVFNFSGFGFFYGSLKFTTLALMAILALIYLSWLAFWWVNRLSQYEQR